ncbi:MauE/DoxX family redox-associated membrane protein [Pontiella sp.]|uniref:MauE/DoxX family redox-associated membrane protein n=1 Tax=Pontiella sp. TaxID=2837462 RepID=UPI0035657791
MTPDQKIYRVAYWIASFVVAATFLAGFQKLLYPADFALAVYRFHLLPGPLVNLVAIYLPWLEAAIAVCLLLVPKFREAALWLALALLALFTAGIVVNLVRGTGFGCGCFSHAPDAKPMDWMSVARNGALMALVVLALFGKKKSQ